ncbi:MAG: AraC family transcriptional regulator [Clostridia bacterium]|nr:AraC family transcriptional regulator [Clostridia bacterium]MBR2877828.1 AraC family transcriptional regulator [Clostridia bacterium]MBR3577070.1 AraC family transcriptional regulator [Clostridia bacterium]
MDKRFYLTDLTEIFDISKIVFYAYSKAMDLTRLKEEEFDFWQLRYINSGSVCYDLDGEHYVLEAGQLLLIPPGTHQKHVLEKSTKTPEMIVISFFCETEALWQLGKKSISVSREEKKLLYNIINLKEEVFEFISGDPDYRGIKPKSNISKSALQHLKINQERLLISLYDRLCVDEAERYRNNKLNREVQTVEAIKVFLEENILGNLTLKEISEHFSYSQSSLKDIFKRITGESIMRYYNNIKLEKAKELIRESTLTIAQIAEMLGYTTASYFSQVFKEATGVAPSQYSRKNLKE